MNEEMWVVNHKQASTNHEETPSWLNLCLLFLWNMEDTCMYLLEGGRVTMSVKYLFSKNPILSTCTTKCRIPSTAISGLTDCSFDRLLISTDRLLAPTVRLLSPIHDATSRATVWHRESHYCTSLNLLYPPAYFRDCEKKTQAYKQELPDFHQSKFFPSSTSCFPITSNKCTHWSQCYRDESIVISLLTLSSRISRGECAHACSRVSQDLKFNCHHCFVCFVYQKP